ncbi:MAG: hypothetical protein EXR67_05845 [Dehalococcoidia bacterium]|nr:hypothetical protein [Dehalococcoidia bacterium]
MTTNPVRIAADQVHIPPTKVTIYEALYRRRMGGGFKEQGVPKDAMHHVLDTAVWAPNHRMTEPWRFFVLPKASAARAHLGEMAYELAMQRYGKAEQAEHARKEVLGPPVLLFVYCVPGPNEETTRENYAAVMCASQNISLACVAEGLAATWETGGTTRHPKLGAALGAEPTWTFANMISIGYPEKVLTSRRTPAEQFVRWLA